MTTREVTGRRQQLPPDVEQVVGGEGQFTLAPGEELPVISDIPRREAPLPAEPTTRVSFPAGTDLEDLQARRTLGGLPVLFTNRYEDVDTDWQELVRWDIIEGVLGDLHEIALSTNNGAKTRYRVIVANREMSIPDRQVASLLNFQFRENNIPGPTSVTVEVRSTDGTSIIVDSYITGTER